MILKHALIKPQTCPVEGRESTENIQIKELQMILLPPLCDLCGFFHILSYCFDRKQQNGVFSFVLSFSAISAV
ncbi:TPA: hypothetical protein DD712_04440, partial [Candidatus Acetothermia bacterium]|nr:hypothetical protein [Candidatus Acetothermia bacterium]